MSAHATLIFSSNDKRVRSPTANEFYFNGQDVFASLNDGVIRVKVPVMTHTRTSNDTWGSVMKHGDQ